MELHDALSILGPRLALALPTTLTAIVLGVLAIARRDAGVWWKLVVGGAVTLVIAQALGIIGQLLIHQLSRGYAFPWLAAVPSIIINAVGLALIGAGALSGRRRSAAPLSR